jgi:hypothetical protein
MTRIALVFISVCAVLVLKAQQNVGIGTTTPAASAALEIEATDKGLLIPRMDSTARKAISSPAEGLMVFDSTYNVFYYYANSAWQEVGATGSTGPAGTYIAGDNIAISNDTISASFEADTMNIISDADNDTKILAEESTDEDHIRFYVSGTELITVANSGEVSIGRDTDSISTGIIESHDSGTPDGSNDGCGSACGIEDGWQSFTLEENETVEYIELYFEGSLSNTDQVTLDVVLYEGQGTSGAVVSQATGLTLSGFQSNDWVTIDVTDFVASSGKYTIYLSNYNHWYYKIGNPYTDGQSSSSSGADYYFRVYGLAYNDNYVKVKSSGLEVGDYLLPYTDGTSGQVLITDGSGAVSWEDTPTGTLISDADNDTKIQVEKSSDKDDIRFDVAGTEVVTIDNSGYVGIGTSNPDARLNLLDSNRADLTLQILDNDAEQGIAFQNNGGAYNWNIYRTPNGNHTSDLRFAGAAAGSAETDITDLNEYVTFQAGGNVGIGTTTPDTTLHIVGQLKYDDDNQANGYVLTSDADGVASWQAPVIDTDTDDQTLSLSGSDLSISEGNTVDLSGIVTDIVADEDGDTKIQLEESTDEDIIRFDIAGTEAVTIGNSGYVGIGTSSPNARLNILDSTRADLTLRILDNNAEQGIAFQNGAGAYNWNIYRTPNGSNTSDLRFAGAAASSAKSDINNLNEYVTFQAGGNVGIGTTTPNTTLHIVGQLKYDDDNQANGYVLTSDADGVASWQAPVIDTDTDDQTLSLSGSDLSISEGNTVDLSGIVTDIVADEDGDTKIQLEESTDEDIIRFDVAGTEAVTIDNSGYVGIGTSSPDARLNLLDSNRADLTLQILDNDAEQGIAFQNSGGAYSWNIYRTPNGNNSSDLRFAGAAVGSSKFQITDLNEYVTFQAGGNVGIGVTNPGYALQVGSVGDGTEARANVWNTFSDRRWKKDFEIIPDALKKLNQVNGYFYNWKEGVDTTQQVGVIAQEIEEILPQAVSTDENGYKSVDYSKLTAWLIQVNKEQQSIIEQQASDIALLKKNEQEENTTKAELESLKAAVEALQTKMQNETTASVN